MGFKKEVREALQAIARQEMAMKLLEKQLGVKDAIIKELLNRVMAVDYRKFQIYSEAAQGGGIKDLSEIPFDADENIIGEAVEVPSELGRSDGS